LIFVFDVKYIQTKIKEDD